MQFPPPSNKPKFPPIHLKLDMGPLGVLLDPLWFEPNQHFQIADVERQLVELIKFRFETQIEKMRRELNRLDPLVLRPAFSEGEMLTKVNAQIQREEAEPPTNVDVKPVKEEREH